MVVEHLFGLQVLAVVAGVPAAVAVGVEHHHHVIHVGEQVVEVGILLQHVYFSQCAAVLVEKHGKCLAALKSQAVDVQVGILFLAFHLKLCLDGVACYAVDRCHGKGVDGEAVVGVLLQALGGDVAEHVPRAGLHHRGHLHRRPRAVAVHLLEVDAAHVDALDGRVGFYE